MLIRNATTTTTTETMCRTCNRQLPVINCGNCVCCKQSGKKAARKAAGRQMNCQLKYAPANVMIYGQGVSRGVCCMYVCVCCKHTRQITHTNNNKSVARAAVLNCCLQLLQAWQVRKYFLAVNLARILTVACHTHTFVCVASI